MFRVKQSCIDTLGEHVIFIHKDAVTSGNLGFRPLDRVRVVEAQPAGETAREVTGIINFCEDSLVLPDEIGLSEVTFRDLGLEDGTPVLASIAPAPRSVDLVRGKLDGKRLARADFNAIMTDIVEHRHSKVELSMFVLACALKTLDLQELVDYTSAMIDAGTRLDFGPGPIADKHCIGGIPGNRTTMVMVPILASLGVKMPKTSSRAITSPAGTADTMGVLAEVALTSKQLTAIVHEVGACIAWGGALELAPADDILITVERPMEMDTEAQMVASILAKKKTAGATHVLIDIPVGTTAKIRTAQAAGHLAELFRAVAEKIDIRVDVVRTEVRGPIGWGIGPRLEALDVLAVLRRDPQAPIDLREKSLYLAARCLESTGMVAPNGGYRAAQQALDSGAAEKMFNRIVAAQGPTEFPPEAAYRTTITAAADGRIREIDCWEIARVAKQAGAPANVSAGVRLLRTVGDVVAQGDPLYEIHAQSEAQMEFGRVYAESHPEIIQFGF
jgi:thymidine phosphorylase